MSSMSTGQKQSFTSSAETAFDTARKADYKTFSSNPTMSLDEKTVQDASTPLGLSTCEAREKLVADVEDKLKENQHICRGYIDWKDPRSILLLSCAFMRVLELIYFVSTSSADKSTKASILSLLAQAFVISVVAIISSSLKTTQTQRQHEEMVERVRVAVQDLVSSTSHAAPSTSKEDMVPTMLLPSTSYVACYRDKEWQRLPMNLLVKGDIIGLTDGDTAPGDVSLVPINSGTSDPKVYPRGSKIPPVDEKMLETTRCNVTFKYTMLLALCGEMRLFQMQKTPASQDVQQALNGIHRPSTFTEKLLIVAQQALQHLCLAYILFYSFATIARTFFHFSSLDHTFHLLLSGISSLLLCFTCFTSPVTTFVGEAAALSSILMALEDAQRGETGKKARKRKKSASFASNASPGTSFGYSKSSYWTLLGQKVKDVYSSFKSIRLGPLKWTNVASNLHLILRFRLHVCRQAHQRHLPIPLSSFRLVERLGSASMLCCFDDDVLCEQSPSVEEVFLLNDQPHSSSTVLDLHAESVNDETSLKFEDPKWRAHLSLLKPLGLNILINDSVDPVAQYVKDVKYLSDTSQAEREHPDMTSEMQACMLKLSSHLRMLPSPSHLTQLSREIGFVPSDLSCFQKQQSLHLISPALARHDHAIDTHDQGREDSRYRGNLKTHLDSTVLLDNRSGRYQVLSRGHVTTTLGHCSEYWDGKSICPLSKEKRKMIDDMYVQWRGEDLDVVAFSYAPVSSKYTPLFQTKKTDVLPPVYLVEDSNESDSGKEDFRKSKSTSGLHHASSPSSRLRHESRVGALSSSFLPSSTSSHEHSDLLASIQQDQIFLGMVATNVQPKKPIPSFLDDLNASGVRFVYFSPRNMRRSKLLAEKMGIETDWNCAISLRPLTDDSPDPHRMKSNYSDWDVKARLPHGVKAIKKHLDEVDNVPLLVSLYTDSTPETVREMIEVFQQHEEVVLGVGSAFNEANSALFSKADCAVSLTSGDLRCFFEKELPPDPSAFCAQDGRFSRLINTLSCAFNLNNDEEGKGVDQLLELLRVGREILDNYTQLLTFAFVSSLFLATVVLAGSVLPFPSSSLLHVSCLLYLLYVFLPAVSISLLFTPAADAIMERTPRKNENIEVAEEMPRLTAYFVLRHVPSTFMAIVCYQVAYAFCMVAARDRLNPTYANFGWIDFIFHATDVARTDVVEAAEGIAQTILFLFLAVTLLVSSMSYLHRTDSIVAMSPLRNSVWTATAVVLILLHLCLCIGMGIHYASLSGQTLVMKIQELPTLLWICMFLLWPVCVLTVDEFVKSHDRKQMTRFYKFLRMQFDTRLGMWSPK